MNDTLSQLGGVSFAAKVLLALIPLFGVLGGALASWLVAGRNVYINSITAERSKWLEKLRSSISEFQAAVNTYNLKDSLLVEWPERTPESIPEIPLGEMLEPLERISRLAATIQLQLNPDGVIDTNIIALVRQMSSSRHGDGKLIVRAEDLLTRHSQWLLKAEWEKVKWEAGSLVYKANHWNDERRRLQAYRIFASGEGKIEATVSELRKSLTRSPSEPATS